MMISRRHGIALLGAAIATPSLALAQTDPRAPALPPALATLSAVPITTPQGAATTLSAHLAAAPSVVAFWATWCSPCLLEGRQLADIRNRVPADRLNIVGVNMDANREPRRLQRFMERARMNYTQVFGTMRLYRAFNNPGEGTQVLLPRLYIFAADGSPVAAFGNYDGEGAVEEIDRAVNGVLA